MPSRLFSLVLPIVILSAVSAYADLRQSAYRVGGSFRLESFENETNADFESVFGYLARPYLEPGIVLGITKREGSDTFGKAGGSVLWHILPGRQIVPGIGLQLTRTFGYPKISGQRGDFTVGELFGNLEAFVAPSWAVTMRGAYQSWWGEPFDARGFVFRVGISTFLGSWGR